ncbi:hypothetical protein [Natronoarchaeum rubrum]|uniref:hypothetical protein n=1 Tax=Natronoarchaeum rubrum TaxID=755311 RepID=UPI002111D5A5|nr:hypothetical protein [Natronoarchaeum rubrum]
MYVVALSGARGAEVFRDKNDDYREGLRWKDVDLDRGIFEVFGETHENQEVALPTSAGSRVASNVENDKLRAVRVYQNPTGMGEYEKMRSSPE